MSKTTITAYIKNAGVLYDPDSVVLSDETSTYGVKRTDTDAVVVANDTAMSKLRTGVYSYTFTDPAAGLTYAYSVEWVDGSNTHRAAGTVEGSPVSTQDLYNLTHLIRPYVDRVPLDVVQQKLRESARQFLTDTEIWKEDITPIASVEDQDEYAFTTAYDADFYRLRNVKYCSKIKSVSSISETTGTATVTCAAHGYKVGQSVLINGCTGVTAYNATWTVVSVPTTGTFTISVTSGIGNPAGTITVCTAEASDGTDWAFSVYHDIDYLVLDPTPVRTGGVIIPQVTFVPRESNDEFPDWLLARWQFGIVHWCTFILKGMSNTGWYDPRGAELAAMRYHDEVAKAKSEGLRRRHGQPLKVQLRSFV